MRYLIFLRHDASRGLNYRMCGRHDCHLGIRERKREIERERERERGGERERGSLASVDPMEVFVMGMGVVSQSDPGESGSVRPEPWDQVENDTLSGRQSWLPSQCHSRRSRTRGVRFPETLERTPHLRMSI